MTRKKPSSKLRNAWINVTVTTAEKKTIARNAAKVGMTLSSYARFRLLGTRGLTSLPQDMDEASEATAGA